MLAHAISSELTTKTVRQLEGLDHSSTRNEKLHTIISTTSKLRETSHPTAETQKHDIGAYCWGVLSIVGVAPPENQEHRGLKTLCLLGHRIPNTEAFISRRWGHSCTGAPPRVSPGTEVTCLHRRRSHNEEETTASDEESMIRSDGKESQDSLLVGDCRLLFVV